MKPYPLSDPGMPDTRSGWRYLVWLSWRQAPSILAGAVWGMLWMACLALLPFVVGRALNAGIVARNQHEVVLWCGVVVLLGAGSAFAGIQRHRSATANSVAAALHSAQLVTRHLVDVGADLPRQLGLGDAVTVGLADISAIGAGFMEVPIAAGAVCAVVIVAAVLLSTSLALGLTIVLGVPAMMALTTAMVKPLRGRQAEYRRLQAVLSGLASDIASGLRVLRGIGGEQQFSASFHDASERARRAGVGVARANATLTLVQILGPGCFAAAVTWLAATMAIDHTISLGSVVACYGYTVFLTLPLNNMTTCVGALSGASISADRVVAVLRLNPTLATVPNPRHGEESRGLVGAEVLADAASGLFCRLDECVAVVCREPTESSMLARRLARYEDTGEPTLGGVPLRALPLDELRARVLLSSNDDHIFAGTLAEVLAPARRPDAEHDPGEALRASSAEDIVEYLGGGYGALLESGGQNLSGGQQQRIRLARALAADPDFLITVDPTNALDAHTEARVASRLMRYRQGRATVIFTDSPLLLAEADVVFYVVSGTVTARGTHAQLAESRPEYHRTVMRED